jgi:hypothetical protein
MHRTAVRSQPAGATVAPTPGTSRARRRGGGQITDAHYLWLLVALEVLAHGALRRWSRSHHGG